MLTVQPSVLFSSSRHKDFRCHVFNIKMLFMSRNFNNTFDTSNDYLKSLHNKLTSTQYCYENTFLMKNILSTYMFIRSKHSIIFIFFCQKFTRLSNKREKFINWPLSLQHPGNKKKFYFKFNLDEKHEKGFFASISRTINGTILTNMSLQRRKSGEIGKVSRTS